MERIKWFGGVALAYFSLIIIALLVNNPEHAWVYWVATALVIVVLMIFLIEYVNAVNGITGWVLFGTVILILTIVFVTYLAKFPTSTIPVVLFSTGVGKSVLIFSLFAAASVLAIRIAFTAQTEPIMAIMITPVYVSLIAVSLCIFILPFFVIGGLSKLFPDNDKVKALWDLLFIPIYRLQNGNKEKVITSAGTTTKREIPTLASTAGAWDTYTDEKKTKAKPKSIPSKPKDESPGLWDKIKSKISNFTSRSSVDEEELEPVSAKPKVPPLFQKNTVKHSSEPLRTPSRKEYFTDDPDDDF